MSMTKQAWITRKANGNGTAWNKGVANPMFQGANNPNWKGGNVTLVCWECEGHFMVRNYRRDTAHFCSQVCSSQYRDEGKRTADKKIRQSAAYKAWRTLVFERDSYKCVECGDCNKSGRGKCVMLHADHIKPFALYPELRFEPSNGRTLCVPCHKKTGTFGRGAIYRKKCIASA
jgi:5-methylcytosine-specific restriction endonuclease McrA